MEEEELKDLPVGRDHMTVDKCEDETLESPFPTHDGDLSDAVIKVDNICSFLVHRNIMACCSPYFRSLFMYANNLNNLEALSKGKRTTHPVPVSPPFPLPCRRSENENWISWDGIKGQVELASNPCCVDMPSNGQPLCWPDNDMTCRPRLPIAEVTISDISPRAMNDIIQFAHGGQCIVSAENVEELLLAADRFQVTSLIQQCCQFLTKELTIANCISMVKFASHFPHCEELRIKGTRFLLNNFTEVFQRSPEFSKLTSFELTEILWSDNLNVKREESVLEAIVRWVSSDPESNEGFIPTLVSCTRVGLMAPDILRRCVNTWLESNNPNTHSKSVAVKVMAEVLSRQQQQMIEVNPAMFAPRIPRDIIIAVGGSNFGFPLNIMEAFDCRTNKWLPLYPHEFAPRSYHGLASHHGDIYVVGGFNGHTYLSSCCKFQPSLMHWEDVTPMNTKRCYVGVGVLEDCIYAVGGYDGVYRLKSAEKFDVSTNQWSYIASMVHQRSDSGVAVLQDQLYACGGFNGSECVRSVEVYRCETKTWLPMPSMFHRRSGLGVSVYKSCLYAVGGFDGTDCTVRLSVLECFNANTMQWTVLSPMRHPRSNLAVVILEDLLYAIGGYNGKKTTDVVECYDSLSDSWYRSTRLNHNRSALSGCLVSGLPNASSLLKRNPSDQIG